VTAPLTPTALEVHHEVARLGWILTRLERDMERMSELVSQLAVEVAELRGAALAVRETSPHASGAAWPALLARGLRALLGLR
jgi:hypothetical protein